MKLFIDKNVRMHYPDLRIGIVIASNVNNSDYSEELEVYMRKQFLAFAEKYRELDEFLSHKKLAVIKKRPTSLR